MNFWDFVDALEACKPGETVEVPRWMTWMMTEAARQEVVKRERARYERQADGIYLTSN